VFYIFHGEDEFSRAEELARLRGKLAAGDQAMADLNTTILDGNKLTLGELRHACDAMPFMADRRLVIVHNLLSRLTGGGRAKAKSALDEEPAWKRKYLEDLVDYLPNLAPTTRLFFLETKTLPASHRILKLAQAEDLKDKAYVKHFDLPKERDLPRWIQRRIQDKGGTISYEATNMLAVLVGNDLRLLDQETEKLVLYADGQQITTDHVRALVSRAREASIFDLVDCVGRRETDHALRLIHRMLDDGQAPLYLLAMMARQIRILIQVSELRAQGLAPAEMASRLKMHPYVVEKGLAQSHNFSLTQLEAAHQRLVDTDWAIKTGEMDDVLALDTLVVSLTHG
jgi:DNA polymerase-3 subunit delta